MTPPLRSAAVALALLAGHASAARPLRYATNAARRDEPGITNIHVIAHTHDDVGWLKTVDEYYAGLNNSIQHASVRHILESTVESLLKDPSRKFIFVEQAFFQRFFNERSDDEKAVVRQLVAEGRLSFVNGGWSMHDEATTTYVDMIDNTCLGHRYIASEFGPEALPSVTWSIDPFGHSSTQASLLSSPAAGFSALFVSRADYADIRQRTASKSLEYVWQPSASLGPDASTFFSIMNQGLHLYFPLPGLCWDIVNCNDPEIQDDPDLDDYNVDDVVRRNVEQATIQASAYVGDIYYTMGFDFNYEYAEEWFTNLDKLIHYTNLQTGSHGFNMFYSTPAQYARTKIAYPISWPSKLPADSDGFPYADGPHSYWTGFLTSRAALKGYVRTASNAFQALKQFQAAFKPAAELDPIGNPLLELQRAMAVVQHHDAVAGTSMQHVANDYAKRIARGLAAAAPVWPTSVGCDLANASICAALELLAPVTTIMIYNSQGQALAGAPIRVPVAFGAGVASYAVLDADGAAVTAQLLPLSASDLSLRNDYYGWVQNVSVTSVQWLVFRADVLATGFAFFTLKAASSAAAAPRTFASTLREHAVGDAGAPLSITNGDVSLSFDNATLMLASFASTSLGIDSTPLAQSWFFYNSSTGNVVDSQAGGAYIMRTNSSAPFPIDFSSTTLSILTGPVVSEARVALPWLALATRVWAGRQDFDVEWTVGPIPIADGMGKEVVTRFAAPIATGATWRSDSNCREMVTRVRDFRPSWNATIEEPIAGNYAPVNCAIEVTDLGQIKTLFVVNDRSQSGGSIADGSVELLVHRRLLADDGRGVGEPLNEGGVTGAGLVVRGLHRAGFAPASGGIAAALRRGAMQDVALFAPIVRYMPGAVSSPGAYTTVLAAPLPPNVHLLTFQSIVADVVYNSLVRAIVRLAHLYERGEHPTLSADATVDLAAALSPGLGTLLNCTETTLPGALPLAAAPRAELRYVQGGEARSVRAPPEAAAAAAGEQAMVVTLTPMQVRTWLCDFSRAA
jgi:hypothetical protein